MRFVSTVISQPNGIGLTFFSVTLTCADITTGLTRLFPDRTIAVAVIFPAAYQKKLSALPAFVGNVVELYTVEKIIKQEGLQILKRYFFTQNRFSLLIGKNLVPTKKGISGRKEK